MAPFVTALAVHVTRDLGDEASILGLILVGFGVGTVGGSLFAGHQMRRGRVAVILVGWNLVMAVGLVAMAATEAIPIQVAAAVVTGFAQSMVLVTYLTLRTQYSPDDLLGRVGMTSRMISLGLQPIGLLVGGALIDLTSGSATIAVIGIAVAGVSLVFAPLPSLRRASLAPR
jgi:predicted MFS family arabinose efflux permease